MLVIRVLCFAYFQIISRLCRVNKPTNSTRQPPKTFRFKTFQRTIPKFDIWAKSYLTFDCYKTHAARFCTKFNVQFTSESTQNGKLTSVKATLRFTVVTINRLSFFHTELFSVYSIIRPSLEARKRSPENASHSPASYSEKN